MFRRLQASSVATVASVSEASQYLSQQPTQMRQYQDNNGQFTEAAFIDRMDLQQIYPTAKPKVNAGDFGYVRGTYSCLMIPWASGDTTRFGGKVLSILRRQSDGSWKIYRDCFNSNGLPAI